MKLRVDKENCISCGACLATDLFEFDDDGRSTPKVDVVPKEMESLAKEAIDSCPVGVIYEEENNSAVEEKNAA